MKNVLFAVFLVAIINICRGDAQAEPTIVKKYKTSTFEEAGKCALYLAGKVGGEVFNISDTGSMEPYLGKNTLVIVVPVKACDIVPGDIIVYHRRNGERVMHRVHMRLDEETWRTKGDANRIADVSPVRFSQVSGRVIIAIRHD